MWLLIWGGKKTPSFFFLTFFLNLLKARSMFSSLLIVEGCVLHSESAVRVCLLHSGYRKLDKVGL